MTRPTTIFFFLLSCSFIWASPENIPATPQIICNDAPLLDEEIQVEVVGLTPFQVVTLEASWIDEHQVQWVSEAVFDADENGTIQLAYKAPITGSYSGIDAMGLFWSMEMQNVLIPKNLPRREESILCDNGYCIPNQIRVLDEKKEIASKVIYRALKAPEVEMFDVRENGLVGNLFIPPSEKPLPVVIVLAGSEGGMRSATASLFASHGIAAFALAYSKVEGFASTVKGVPLEYFEKAFEWIKNHPKLNGEIALHGTSRGAELSLILGSMFPDKIQKIVASAPSSVVLHSDSWTYKNKPVLPAAPYFIDVHNDPSDKNTTRENPISYRIHRERGLWLERERFDAATIPVEQIDCPILLISGGADRLGPNSVYAELIMERLEKNNSSIERTHLNYPSAGHLIVLPYLARFTVLCDRGVWIDFGGTCRDDEWASRDSWKKTIEFLKDD